MKQLIRIQTVPIRTELRKTEPKIQYENATVQQEMNTKKGGMAMKTHHAKVNTKTFLVPETTHAKSIEEFAAKGNQVAGQATSQAAQRGRQMGSTQGGLELMKSYSRADNFKNIKMNIGIDWIPERAPEVSFEPGDLQMNYEADKLEFDWKMSEQKLHFEHGKVELVVTQKPEVIIEYIGDPVYVPDRSGPEYVPLDTKG